MSITTTGSSMESYVAMENADAHTKAVANSLAVKFDNDPGCFQGGLTIMQVTELLQPIRSALSEREQLGDNFTLTSNRRVSIQDNLDLVFQFAPKEMSKIVYLCTAQYMELTNQKSWNLTRRLEA